MFDLIGSVGIKALLVARRIGVLDALSPGPMTVDGLAQKVDADGDRLRLLLDVLVEWRYLRKRRGVYSLTRGTLKWLTTDSESGWADFVDWWDSLVLPYWDAELGNIIDGVQTGQLYRWVGTQPEGWQQAQAGFEATARLILPAFVKHIRVPQGRVRMVDAGGGHGLYSIALCTAHEELEADIFDVPEALGPARSNVALAGLESRIRIVPGDLTIDHLGEDYGMALMANVIHGFSPEENRDILRRLYDALQPGGTILILDQVGRVPGRLGKAIHAMLQLAYLTIGRGRIYQPLEVEGWLEDAGFIDQETTKLRGAPGNGVITATRP